MGEADWLVLQQMSMVFLSLINSIPDIIVFGAFVIVFGDLTRLRNQDSATHLMVVCQ